MIRSLQLLSLRKYRNRAHELKENRHSPLLVGAGRDVKDGDVVNPITKRNAKHNVEREKGT